MPIPGGVGQNADFWAGSSTPTIGTRPVASSKPPFRTDVTCQSQPIPDLNGPAAAQGPPNPAPYP
jgi:hypothetical protein